MISKLTPAWPALACLLSACAPSPTTGPIDDGPHPVVVLPAAARVPCADPATLLQAGGTVADDAVSILRLGDALIACDGRRRVAVEAVDRR